MEITTHPLSFEDTETAFASKSDNELKKTYRLFSLFNQPLLLKLGTGITQWAFRVNLPIKPLVKNTMFHQFCGGETLKECETAIQNLSKYNIKTVLEYGIETKSTEAEFDRTVQEILRAIEFAASNKSVKIVSCKVTGLARFGLLENLHEEKSLDEMERKELDKVRQRLDQICHAADKANVGIFIDAEESWIQKPIDDLADELMQKFNREKAVVFNTFQLYLQNRFSSLKAAFDKAGKNGYLLGAKLVRGAYMEKERARAKMRGVPSPIHADKKMVDEDYNRALEFCMNNIQHIVFCAATHNEQSCRLTASLMEEKGMKNHPHIFFSQLFGMGEHLTYKLAKEGFAASKLIPYGPVEEAVPYLIRRAEENSSVAGHTGRELVLLEKEIKRRGMR